MSEGTDRKTDRGQTKFQKEDGGRKYFVEAADGHRKGQTEEGKKFRKEDGGRKYFVSELLMDGERKQKRWTEGRTKAGR
jgi:hypothetical protein